MCTSMRTVAGCLFAVSIMTPGLLGQATGTIYGTVYDPSGAVLPGATIGLTNEGTNQMRTVRADGAGKFVAPLLPAGTYRVRIDHSGFSSFVQHGVTLEADTTVQVPATLQLTATAQNLVVNANATLVQANSTNLVQVVDQRRIEDLPLNGRNVLQLMALDAGISDRNTLAGTPGSNGYELNETFAVGAYASPVASNGQRADSNNFMLDNTNNNDAYTNISLPFPNPDAVQEFSIQTSTFDAQYGRQPGAIVNVVTKSGTNQFHGTVYDFLRNYDMNAANFFSGLDTLKRNQFGGAIGGPVTIPRLYQGKDKTFFFFDYQGTRQTSSTPRVFGLAGTSAMQHGDFSAWLGANGVGQVLDPLNNQPFPNNQIPASRFDPVVNRLLQYMPPANAPNYQYVFSTPTVITNDDQVVFRLDHMLSDKQRISLRYFFMNFNQPWALRSDQYYYVVNAAMPQPQQGQFAHLHNLALDHTISITPKLLNEVTLSYHLATPKSVPPTDVPNFQSLGANISVVPAYAEMQAKFGSGGWTEAYIHPGYYSPQETIQVSDNLSYATGRHNMRFGMDAEHYRFDNIYQFQTGGFASFGGNLLAAPGKSNGGVSYAEFMLGDVGSWAQYSPTNSRYYNAVFAAYAQDDVRVTSKLTLNVGLRWAPTFPYTELQNHMLTFMPGQQSTAYPTAPTGLLFPGDAGVPNGILNTRWRNFAPRIGVAYQVAPKTVIRSAYGVFQYEQYPAFLMTEVNAGSTSEPFVTGVNLTGVPLSNPYQGGVILDPNAPLPNGKTFPFHTYDNFEPLSRGMSTPYTQSWNLVLEHQFGNSSLVRAAYVGTKSTHLPNSVQLNPGIYGPGATAGNLNARRPYQPVGSVLLNVTDLNAEYDSLQLTFQRRLSRGITLLANYTYSKALDYASSYYTGVTTPFNYRASRGVSDFDIPQRFVASGVWDLPALKGASHWLRTIAGGWQNNFIFTAESGPPLTITSGVSNDLEGLGTDYADLTGVPWQISGGRSKAAQIGAWFNVAAFKTNAVGTQGTGGRNQVWGPGVWNLDYSLFKTFVPVERLKLQVRGEFFNILNHANLGPPNTVATSPQFAQITTASSPRILQLGMKVVF